MYLTVPNDRRQMHRFIIGVTIVIYFFYSTSSGYQCPKQNLCKCRFHGEDVDLYCVGTEELIELKECLQEKFHNLSIRFIFVKKCNATSLPGRFIHDIKVKILYMRCPLLKFSDEAFVDSYDLFFEFRLYSHRLSVIPDAFTSTPLLQRLWITNGTLESVEEQFRILTQLKVLSLSKNRIRYISPSAFIYTTSLVEVYLSHNPIKHLDSKTFHLCNAIVVFMLTDTYLESAEGLLDSMNPRVLNLGNNNLTDIHIFHPKMWRTTKLHLNGNPVGDIDSTVFLRNLINIVQLDLSNMSLTEISGKAFTAFPVFQTLDLSNNQLERIHKKTFYNLPLLKDLNLSRNQLTSIGGIFQNHRKMSTLDVSHNRIEALEDSLSQARNLVMLNARSNNIQSLTDEDFRRTVGIKYILANVNNISTLSKGCFRYLLGLVEINLSSNNLVSLNGSISNLPSLKKLYLAFNRIAELRDDDFVNVPKLYYLNLMNNHLASLNRQFLNIRYLEYLNIQHNRIVTLSRDVFPEVLMIRTLYFKDNPLSCDCRLEWLRSLSKKHRVLKDSPRCQAPYWLKGKLFRNLSDTALLEWKGSCPLPCECICRPNGAQLGRTVDCSQRNLTMVPETFPSRMIALNIADNNITVIRRPVANRSLFDDLQELDVENNQVNSVEGLRFLKRLSILKLANNSLETLEVTGDSNYSLVTLSGNPWLCDCSTLWFRSWLLTVSDTIPDINQTMCERGNVKKELLNTPVIYLSESDICPTKIALYIFISIGALAFLLLVTSFSFTYFRYRLTIKVWLYAHGFSCVKEEDIDKDKPFDAFVSFSCKDERFVYNILTPTLESDSPPYVLCVHDRNFPGGGNIQESIMSAVKNSKRTILVLSKNFLESEWCTLEFRAAHLQALEDKMNRVIVIIYGQIPPTREIDEELQV